MRTPDDGTIGLLVIPTLNTATSVKKSKDNFVMCMKSGLSNEDIVEIGRLEAPPIISLSMKKGKRSGSSGGVMIPAVNGQEGHNPISCSKGTKNTGYSTEIPIQCLEVPVGSTKILLKGIYPYQYINWMTETQKRKEVKRTASIRRILIKDMEEQLIALVVVEHCKLHDRDGSTSHYALMDELEAAIKKATHVETQKKWRTLDPSINLWEMILLEYACETGEIHNHQALAAHCDGNISH